MKRLIGIIIAGIIAFVGLNVATSQTASAGTNGGVVHNKTGSPVKVWCDYSSGPLRWLYEDKAYGAHWSTSVCGADTDRLSSYKDGRCLKIVGPKVRDGYYYIKPTKKYKIYGATVATVVAYKSSTCSKSREYPIT